MVQRKEKTITAENFMRSATAPMIRAGVMAANIAWKSANVAEEIRDS